MKAKTYDYLIEELNKILAIVCNKNDLLKINEEEVEKRKKKCLELINEERQVLKEYKNWQRELHDFDATYETKRKVWLAIDNRQRIDGVSLDSQCNCVIEMKDPLDILSKVVNEMSELINKIRNAENDYSVEKSEEQLAEVTKLLEKINDYKPKANNSSAEVMPGSVQVITPGLKAEIVEETEVGNEDDDKLCEEFYSDFELRLKEMKKNGEEKPKKGLFRH